MQQSSSKNILIGLVVLVVILCSGVGIYRTVTEKKVTPLVVVPEKEIKPKSLSKRTIGTSVEGRPIEGYSFGEGSKRIVFVGGIHGGYEWNSVMLAYMFIDYLTKYPELIPEGLLVDVIPSANPDGLYRVTGKVGRFSVSDVSTSESVLASGRFNAHNVDLNRNFDCKWQPKSTWRAKVVSAGVAVFSEPESVAIRNFILETKPVATVFWHSQSNGVYASQCSSGILPKTLELMSLYSGASGYKAVNTFDAYQTTGAVDDWLASVGIPAVTVELKTHESVEWEANLAGVKAVLQHYGQ